MYAIKILFPAIILIGDTAVYELIQVGKCSYYVQSPSKAGLVLLDEKNVCLIDSGSDKDAARKIRQHLDANGWHLAAIYNTHSHADHIGGNQYLQKQTGCKIYAPGIESCFTCHPILEPAFLWGGFPPREMHNKFLLAQESACLPLTQACLPEGYELIPLPGHSYDMCGIRTPDGVVYLADCLSSRETLEKYQIGFLYDVGAYLETLEKVKQMDAALFVPAHAEATDHIAPLAQFNIDQVQKIARCILDFCQTPLTFEALLQKLFDHFLLTMTIQQHALVGSTVRSYLSWLKNEGKMNTFIDNNLLLFQST